MKYYVVWNGENASVYTSWDDCQQAIKGVKGVLYKSFATETEAKQAFLDDPHVHVKKPVRGSNNASLKTPDVPSWRNDTVLPLHPKAVAIAWAVDAACSGNPGPMEYQAVDMQTGARIFHFGPMLGTNNIGEFLAIVHALALMEKQGITDRIIYSDSVNAQLWVRNKKCKTKLERNERTEQLFQIVERAEKWLSTHSFRVPIVKWDTKNWGEIPADFGRK